MLHWKIYNFMIRNIQFQRIDGRITEVPDTGINVWIKLFLGLNNSPKNHRERYKRNIYYAIRI